LPALIQAPIQARSARPKASRACLVWWWLLPAWWPGKKAGRWPAVSMVDDPDNGRGDADCDEYRGDEWGCVAGG
jgi:hypothetical protein